MNSGFLQLAQARYSVRRFKPQPVSQQDIDKILQAGHYAPTACNLQPQRVYVFDTEEKMRLVRKCTRSHFNAPAALLVCYDENACWQREYDGKRSGEVDASIVATHMMLEAADIGVGTTWVMHFIPEAVTTEFALPQNIVPVALLVMGYPADDAAPSPGHTQYKDPSEIVVR